MNYMYSPMPPQVVARPPYSPNNGPYTGRVRPVSSLEEVRASVIDFDGSVFYFPDTANKRIYTKQINLDGTALLNMYVMQDIPVTPPPEQLAAAYVSKDEFQQTITLLLEEMNKLKGAQNGEQLQSNDVDDAEPRIQSTVHTSTKNGAGKK
jgi:hypothetical protein